MPPILGRTQSVGLGKETTAGTAVAPTVWIPHQDMTVEDRKDVITDNSALGTRYGAFAVDTSLERAEGNINGLVYDRSFGHILRAAMGSVSTAAHGAASGVNVHTFSVANTLPSYTIAKKDGNESVRHAYGVCGSLEINVDMEGYAGFTSSWLARKGTSTANTVAFTTENRFRPQDVTVKVANDVASLTAATPARFRSLSLSINNNLFTEPVLGTTNPEYYPGVVETSISFGKLYVDTTFKDLVFGTTPKALRIEFNRADAAIGTGTPTTPSIVFDFEPGFFAEWSREGGLDDLKAETISYQPIYSTSASKQFGAVMTNTEASY